MSVDSIISVYAGEPIGRMLIQRYAPLFNHGGPNLRYRVRSGASLVVQGDECEKVAEK